MIQLQLVSQQSLNQEKKMTNQQNMRNDVGVVIIGRNEGQRLLHCIESLLTQTNKIVYVDSGSTDGSAEAAIRLGTTVVSLDMQRPFTAARARNEGFEKAISTYKDIQFIQFVDGDCQVFQNWITKARDFLVADERVAVVCGRRKEIYPNSSVYNMLCDIEWNTPVGEAKACGGDALMRVDALKAVGGYRNDLIAGEEPELCVRLRAEGWKIWRIDAEMTMHDANITRFSQWWKRSVRAGYAYAQGASIHGSPPERHWVAESRRAFLWAGVLPLFILLGSIINHLFLLSIFIYPLQILRIALRSTFSFEKAIKHAFFLTIGKFPELVGGIRFIWHRFCRNQSELIEYK